MKEPNLLRGSLTNPRRTSEPVVERDRDVLKHSNSLSRFDTASITETFEIATLLYPSLLSNVSLTFQKRIKLRSQFKDNLEYKNCFTGKEAVVLIA